eukprot:4326366-Pyramimonas_sp.AAC.1
MRKQTETKKSRACGQPGTERPKGRGRAQGDQRSRRTSENKQQQTKPLNWASRGAERPNGGGRARGDRRSRRTSENKQIHTKPMHLASRGAERPRGGGRA